MQVFFDGGLMGLGGFIWLLIGTGVLAASVRKTDRVEGFLLLMLVLEFALVSVSDNMLDYLVYNWYLWFVLGTGISLHFQRRAEKADALQPRIAESKRLRLEQLAQRGK
jgi:hypothetical protein